METFPPEMLTALACARQITVLTGAGVSAESGIPTFRDAQTGLWSKYRPEELATRDAFAHNPQRVWEWYAYRRRLISEVQPNPGHYALAELEQYTPACTVITQNIDGLHQVAGSRQVVELHGSIWRTKCFDCNQPHRGGLDDISPPVCEFCGGLVRPDVVWFGESLPGQAYQAARDFVQNCDVFLTIGTSGLVQPAASLPILAVEQGAVCIEINPEATPLTTWMAYSLRGMSGSILPAILRELSKERSDHE